jgi:hypothetical protein
MPIVSKKIKALQKDVLIKNQIATLLNKSNTTNLPQPLQQSTANADYYVSLYQNDNRDLSFNTTSNNLITKNLVIQNPPSCYVDASNSYDLVNKSHMNKYVGFDLYAGNKWYCEDWITGDVSGNFNWNVTVTSGGIVRPESANVSHVGIVRLRLDTNANSSCLLTLPTNIGFFSSKLKIIRFLSRSLIDTLNVGNVFVYYGVSNDCGNISAKHASWVYKGSTQCWECNLNGNTLYTLLNSGSNVLYSRFANQWVLFEIEFDSLGHPSFYIRLLGVTERTLIYKESTLVVDTTALLRPYAYIKNESSVRKEMEIDYIDWVVST